MLQAITRRGALKNLGLLTGVALFGIDRSELTFAADETPAPILIRHVLALTRTINTMIVVLFEQTQTYPHREAILDRLREVKKHQKPGSPVDEWASRLNFETDEILPGWFIDYEVMPGNTGYILIITGRDGDYKSVVITDEGLVIYRAKPFASDNLPTAREITRAQDFPGARAI